MIIVLRLEAGKTFGLRAKKFDIVNNNHGRTHKWDFSVFNRETPFLG